MRRPYRAGISGERPRFLQFVDVRLRALNRSLDGRMQEAGLPLPLGFRPLVDAECSANRAYHPDVFGLFSQPPGILDTLFHGTFAELP